MSKLLRSRRDGFTLIELMIVVAIIGILAAIAIPNFLRFQLRARSSEGKTNLAAIRTSEESYNAEFGGYIAAAVQPTNLPTPSSTKQAFGAPNAGFTTIGWSPEGNVFFRYGVATGGSGAHYTAAGDADIDANGTNQVWGYIKPDAAGNRVDGPLACAVAGPLTNQTVGPCTTGSGQSIF